MLCKTIAAGGVLFVIENRIDGEDQGASLSLLVEARPDAHTEPRLITIWRVDCIMRDPHVHRFNINLDDESTNYPNWFARLPMPVEGVTESEPATFGGSVETFMQSLLDVGDIIKQAGYEAAADIDQSSINAAAGEIQQWMTLAQDADKFTDALLAKQ